MATIGGGKASWQYISLGNFLAKAGQWCGLIALTIAVSSKLKPWTIRTQSDTAIQCATPTSHEMPSKFLFIGLHCQLSLFSNGTRLIFLSCLWFRDSTKVTFKKMYGAYDGVIRIMVQYLLNLLETAEEAVCRKLIKG